MANVTCYYPKPAKKYLDKDLLPKLGTYTQRPCGYCIGCRLDKAKDWAIRCIHEAQLHKQNCFITLTFDDKHLPDDLSVDKPTFQKFIKRLREKTAYPGNMPLYDKAMRIQYYRKKGHEKYGEPKPCPVYKEIRYYACAEYGDSNPERNLIKYGHHLGRPHYHICLFGHEFKDKEIIEEGGLNYFKSQFRTGEDYILYKSKELAKIWPNGFHTIGELNEKTAGYVARYCVKKMYGKKSKDHYGEREPEFSLMSRMPGIGSKWLKKYQTDVYPKDYTTHKGKRYRPPRYYDSLLEKKNPKLMEEIKKRREEKRPTPEPRRRPYAEKGKKLVTKSLKRNLHNEKT